MVFSVVWGIQLVVVDATGAVILSGNTLTFAATDFEARSDRVYSVIITASEADKSSVSKTITVTVTDLNDVAPTNHHVWVVFRRRKSISRGNTKCPIVIRITARVSLGYGYSDGFFSR
jgi:Cu/Ag efflux pump CusA